jgi:ATP-binding cassette subfamily B (MDR/TAP) protein 1
LYIFIAIGFSFGFMQNYHDRTEPGDVFICVGSIIMGAYFLGIISPHILCILKSRVSASIIYEKIDRIPKIDCTSKNGKSIKNSRGLVEFKNVFFAYPSRPSTFVLNGATWDAKPGETVALVKSFKNPRNFISRIFESLLNFNRRVRMWKVDFSESTNTSL